MQRCISAAHDSGNPLLLGLTPAQYVLRALANIRSADLEQALLLLPFSFALDLLPAARSKGRWQGKGQVSEGAGVEMGNGQGLHADDGITRNGQTNGHANGHNHTNGYVDDVQNRGPSRNF